MNSNEPDDHDAQRNARLVDLLLGELTEPEALDLTRETAADPEFAQDAAELRCLFGHMRELTTEPTGRVAMAVRTTLDRRLRLRSSGNGFRPKVAVVFCLKVAAVAAVVVGSVLFAEQWLWEARQRGAIGIDVADSPRMDQVPPWRRPVPGTTLDNPAVADPSPASVDPAGVARGAARAQAVARVGHHQAHHEHRPERIPMPFSPKDSTLARFFAPFERGVNETSNVGAWLCARNHLASLRREFVNRFSPVLRRRAIYEATGSDLLAARIEALAGEVATKVDRGMRTGGATVQDVALSLRALIAGGSTQRIGDHKLTVRRCVDYLEAGIRDLEGGELATALSGLMDMAVVSGSNKARLVRDHTVRLMDSILFSNPGDRPSMLNWDTTPAQMADAGQVLRLAPAFDVDATQALRARAYLATHVAERIALSRRERPDLLAARLYGFGELGDRAHIERKLRLWHARDLVPDHFVALHHISWSRFPLRSGWAAFQRELRNVSTASTPASATDASALLLTLAVHYAAPGSHELFDVAMR